MPYHIYSTPVPPGPWAVVEPHVVKEHSSSFLPDVESELPSPARFTPRITVTVPAWDDPEILRWCYYLVFGEALEQGFTNIALPLFGLSDSHRSKEMVWDTAMKEILEYLQSVPDANVAILIPTTDTLYVDKALLKEVRAVLFETPEADASADEPDTAANILEESFAAIENWWKKKFAEQDAAIRAEAIREARNDILYAPGADFSYPVLDIDCKSALDDPRRSLSRILSELEAIKEREEDEDGVSYSKLGRSKKKGQRIDYEALRYALTTEESFSEMTLRLIDESGQFKSDPEFYTKANITRQVFSRMRSKTYQPDKKTALRVVLTLQLEKQQADSLLKAAGYALSPSIPTDRMISYCLDKRIYSLIRVESMLQYLKQLSLDDILTL